ncbi:hypothetical protein GGQ77_001858 [Geobacillus thermodenitrificans]|nr:hypothetical protein [Geobacillus thermodenitrificans]
MRWPLLPAYNVGRDRNRRCLELAAVFGKIVLLSTERNGNAIA